MEQISTPRHNLIKFTYVVYKFCYKRKVHCMEMTQSSSNSLEEAARKRKERLNNFKRKRQSDTTSTNPGKAHLPK